MDFALSGEQEMLKSLVERYVADHYAGTQRAAYRALPRGYDDANWALLASLGLLALPFDEAFGGMGGGVVELITVLQAFGHGLVVDPVLDEIVIAGGLLQAAGTLTQKEHWLPKIIAGEAHAALAYAEHATRYRLDLSQTRFAAGRLSGAKSLVPAHADLLIVTAEESGTQGLYLVQANAAGLTQRTYRLVDGSAACELHFDNVSAELMQAGLEALEDTALMARMAASAEMVGLMGRLFDATLEHVRARHQFGTPIGSFQAIQHRLADVYASLELARSHLIRCALAPAGEREAAIHAAKSYISASAIRLGEECIQFHGGMGVSDELPIGHAHKRILVLAQVFGDADRELVRYNQICRAA